MDDTDTTPEPDRGITLAELIRQHQRTTGDSYADIARKAGLSKPRIGQFADPRQHFVVRAATVESLARGLQLPVATVQKAALATAGYDMRPAHQDERLTRIIDRLQELDDDQLGLVTDLVETIAKRNT
jgi:transcriptional regulator with XRE-family HTH domain